MTPASHGAPEGRPAPKRRAQLRMAAPSGVRERYVAAFLFGLALFFPPLLAVFDVPVLVLGLPLLFLYLFLAWLGLILVLALIVERGGDDSLGGEDGTEAGTARGRDDPGGG